MSSFFGGGGVGGVGGDMTQTASSSSVDGQLGTPIQDNNSPHSRVSPTFTSNSRKRKTFYTT